jgi:acetate kinase
VAVTERPNVLVVNAGSASLKLRLLDGAGRMLATADVQRWHGAGHTEPIEQFAAGQHMVDAVGHRVVHGGAELTGPVLIDAAVRERLAGLTDLAPLHQPRSLAGIDAAAAALPGVPAVACFDTAFHAGLPDAAAVYALPASWRRRWGLRRYGFHGLSHAYAARRAAELVGRPLAELRTVVCHLGSGASLCAVHGGRSVDTTMGFTPLEGLVMATRCGTVDPGLPLWLLRHGKLGVAEVADALERESGLAGLAELPGGSGDLRDVRAAAERGSEPAALALRVFGHRLRREIAAMAAAMNGLDVLVFTGGIGEHDAAVRADTAAGLAFLGVHADGDRNRVARGDADISAADSPVRVLVVTAREDLEIAAQTRHTCAAAAHSAPTHSTVGVPRATR